MEEKLQLFSEKELTKLLDVANRCLLDASRQQLVQLVLDTPLISSPLACSRRSIGKNHSKTPASLPVVKEEVPVIDSFLKKENVCTLTKTDGLAGTDWKVCKTEEHHSSSSSSPEAGSKDNKAGSRGCSEGTNSGEKPSTSVVKVVNKGEILNFLLLFCSLPQVCGCIWLCASVCGIHLLHCSDLQLEHWHAQTLPV